MKKLTAILLVLTLVLALAACGLTLPGAKPTEPPAAVPDPTAMPTPTAAPAATETPAPTEAPAPTETPKQVETPAPTEEPTPRISPYPLLIPIGTEATADLNGDGTDERVCVSLTQDPTGWQSVVLTLNGEDMSDTLDAEGVYFDCPADDYWAITDIYSADGLLEIAVQEFGPSDDYYTHFFRFDGGGLYTIGGTEGLLWNAYRGSGDLSFDEDGFIGSYMRLHVLQTWFADVRYEIAPREWLEVVPQELYYPNSPAHVTVKRTLLAYDGPDGESFPVEPGTEMDVVATDDAEWIVCRSETEDWQLWFRLDTSQSYPMRIETPDGFAEPWDALDGLLFAD